MLIVHMLLLQHNYVHSILVSYNKMSDHEASKT